MASREVLIKSVAMAIPTYPMSCFKFPSTTCKQINSDLRVNSGGEQLMTIERYTGVAGSVYALLKMMVVWGSKI